MLDANMKCPSDVCESACKINLCVCLNAAICVLSKFGRKNTREYGWAIAMNCSADAKTKRVSIPQSCSLV